MLTDTEEKCLMAIAPEADKATYSRVKARLRNIMHGDKAKAYSTLQGLTGEVSYPELALALAELAILDGRVKWGSALIEHMESKYAADEQG